MSQQVTIIVPNYKTLTLTQLCLRLLRKYTDPALAKVIVVDNDSADDSLAYLKTLSWIELIERKAVPGESGPRAHTEALDLALSRITTPYVLSIHTDTLIKRADWLTFLLSHLINQPQVSGVGSWKLETKSFGRQLLKQIENIVQLTYARLLKRQHVVEGVDDNYFYLRSHCALYRMEALRQLNLHFGEDHQVAGKVMHKKLVEAGYQMVFLPSYQLIPYLDHINHATMVLNPHLGSRQKSIDKGLRRIERNLAQLNAQAILQDASLDR